MTAREVWIAGWDDEVTQRPLHWTGPHYWAYLQGSKAAAMTRLADREIMMGKVERETVKRAARARGGAR